MISSFSDLTPALAEILMAIGAMALLLLGVWRTSGSYGSVHRLTVILMAAAIAVLLGGADAGRQVTFGGMFVQDNFAVFAKILILLGAMTSLLLARGYMRDHQIDKFEYPILIALATLGMLVMVSANSLLALYIGLELQSLSLYVLAAFHRDRARSTEAGLKYFILGALSSGMLLYGISLVYGFSGTIEFDLLAEAFDATTDANIGVIIGMVFILAGLSFKISAVPFHMWAPDVYEGAPTPVTAFFAAAPKIAAMMLFIRVVYGAFGGLVADWQQIVIFMSIASMLVGAFIALVQVNIKRLLAYSSIGHVGYALVGMAAGTQAGVEAMLIYLAIYLTMTLGTFAVVLTMRRGGVMLEEISELAGLSKTNLPLAVAMAIFMFSLAGIPLLAGFFGKWFVFKAAVDAGLWPLAVFGVVTSVVGAYYYLRVVKIMFFDEAEPAFDHSGTGGVRFVIYSAALVNSPVSYLLLIAPLTALAAWAARGLLL